jgi:hypothetical protein
LIVCRRISTGEYTDLFGVDVMLVKDNVGLRRATDPKHSIEILDSLKSLNMVAVISMMLMIWFSI